MSGQRDGVRVTGRVVPWEGCLVTGKRGYATRAHAKLALSRWDSADRRGLTVYRCHAHPHFHIGTAAGLTREDHRRHHEGREPDPEWIPVETVAARLSPVNVAKMRAVLERMAAEGLVEATGALGVTLIRASEVPRLRLAAHDRGQDRRLKEL